MAMPTDLPFLLYLWEGEGSSVRRIPLNLSLQPVNSSLVQITENLLLSVELVAYEDDIEVSLLWDQLIDPNDTVAQNPIVLFKTYKKHILAQSMEEYPWRPGRYQYRVIFQETTFYGAFEVLPRNVTEEQMESIHDTLNQTLEGLVLDYLRLKRAASDEVHLQHLESWRFFAWYKSVEKDLLHALKAIEQNHEVELKYTYTIESIERRQTIKSIRWSHAGTGVKYDGTKTLNRRMVQHPDSESNRLIKHWVRSILTVMVRSMASLQSDYNVLSLQYDQLESSIEHDAITLQEMKEQKVVSKVHLEQLSRTIYGKKQHVSKLAKQLSELQRFDLQCGDVYSALKKKMNTFFWRDVQDQAPRRMVHGQHHAYGVIYEIWKSATSRHKADHNRSKELLVPVVKPTSLLYEYYVLFKTIESFRYLGYEPQNDTITEQLQKSFHLGGLQPGTSVRLKKDQSIIAITYDDQIEHHEKAAMDKQTHFFSHEANRRPDIRVDLYTEQLDTNVPRYVSSFIVEVKYRPIWNIYSSVGYTETMLQMSKYFMFRYVGQEKGSKRYVRTPVHNVVCVYPGDEQHEPLIETGCGSFLQLFPAHQGETVGLDLLMYILKQWLETTNLSSYRKEEGCYDQE
jgi:hypothetical protein